MEQEKKEALMKGDLNELHEYSRCAKSVLKERRRIRDEMKNNPGG